MPHYVEHWFKSSIILEKLFPIWEYKFIKIRLENIIIF